MRGGGDQQPRGAHSEGGLESQGGDGGDADSVVLDPEDEWFETEVQRMRGDD